MQEMPVPDGDEILRRTTMSDELIQKARWQAKQQALDNPRTGTCDDANCSINIVLAAESGFDAGVRAERERAIKAIQSMPDDESGDEGGHYAQGCINTKRRIIDELRGDK